MAEDEQRAAGEAPAGPKRGVMVVRMMARVTLLAIIVQFMLAGLGTFDADHGETFKDSYFSAHRTFALVIIGLAVIMFITSLVVRAGRTLIVQTLVLALAVGPVQSQLAQAGADHAAWVGSLHVLTAVLILVLDARIADMGASSRRRKPAGGEAPGADAADAA